MKKSYLTIIICLATLSGHAQQWQHFTVNSADINHTGYEKFRDLYMHFDKTNSYWFRNDGMWKQNENKTWVPLTPEELKK